ncbi:MAG: TonB-dependent receptor [Alistipes sp.]
MSMFAQSAGFEVSGVVSDKNGAIIGASVLVKGTTIGTSTDGEGAYSITIPKSPATLEFSFIGYKTREIPVTSATKLNVVLEEDAQTLADVVVLGFGAASRKADLSTSVGVMNNVEENKNRPVSSVANMLQGQMAGVTVVNNGGDPTASPSVMIRGMGSQANENVLWVVDGVPGAPYNINDVESIVVLKDAASAAIYGAQSGAAGVVLVTTKRAKSGAPSVTYEGNYGVRVAANLPQSLSVEQERMVRTQSLAASGQKISDLWDPIKNPEMAQTRTDWIDEVFRTALYQRHQVSVSGGTDKFASRVSFNYNNDEGTLINTFNKTASIRFDGKYDISRHITISEDAMWSSNQQRGQTTGAYTDEGYTGILWTALSMPRSARAYYDDGSYGGTAEMGSNTAGLHGDLVNPLRLLKANTIQNKLEKFSTTTALNIHGIIPGLKFNSRFTYRTSKLFYKKFAPKTPEPGKPTGTNTLDYATNDFYFWETENTLTYDNTFGRHTVGALISTTASKQRQRSFSVQGRFFDSEAEADQYLSNAGEFMNPEDGFDYPDNNVAIVARLSYSFDNRYFVTGSWRRDYAGRLPKGNKSGDFPAVTGAWKISSEPFFKENDVVTLLKLRASWGRVGNLGSVGYAYGYPMLDFDGNGDGTQVGGLRNSNFPYLGTALNPNLSWETSEQTDIGLDLDMFRSRLSISADFFMKRTFDLIQAQTTNWPDYIGISPMLVNQGEIRNRGFEFSATWKEQVNKDWSYFVSGNFTTLKNWVSDIGVKNEEGMPGVWGHDDSFRGTLKPFQTAEGQPLYTYYLVKTDGLFQSDAEAAGYVNKEGKPIQPNAKAGDLKFIDYDGNGKIDSNDRQYMGSYMPKFTYSFSAGFTWKDLSFSMMWQGAAKTKAFNATKFTLLNESQGVFNRSTDILKAWPASNDVPRLAANDANNNFETASDFYLEDASYLRLKNITISYDLSRLVRKSAKLAARGSSLSVFFSAENLLTITDYTGFDPEVGGIGLDAGRYPVSRVFSFGIKLTY